MSKSKLIFEKFAAIDKTGVSRELLYRYLRKTKVPTKLIDDIRSFGRDYGKRFEKFHLKDVARTKSNYRKAVKPYIKSIKDSTSRIEELDRMNRMIR